MKRIFFVISLMIVALFVYTLIIVQYINYTNLRNIFPSAIVVIALEIITGLFALGITIKILFKQSYAYKKSHWILLMLINPIIGITLYIIFARDYRTKRLERTRPMIANKEFIKFEEITSPQFPENEIGSIFKYIHDITKRSIYENDTLVEVLNNGDEFFPRLIEEIKNAKDYIMMEFYIIKTDNIGCQILDLLKEKAMSGLDVYLLYDHFGSNKFLDRTTMSSVIASGVKVAVFDPQAISFFDSNVNFRNHRKATIIDGKVGFVGGINLGDEYNHQSPKFGFWRDSHVLIKGNGVTSIQNVFIKDWYYVKNEVLEKPLDKSIELFTGFFTVVESGPDFENGLIKDIYLKMINSAKRSIRIVTPYLIIEPEMMTALKIAVQSGVQIKILVPGKSDTKIAGFATRSYYEALLSYGVEIYEYRDHFVHSKILVVDDIIASLGSVNFDPRSFHLNFEVTAIFSNDATNQVVQAMEFDLTQSTKIDINEWNRRGLLTRLIQGFINLFSPLF
jgi:cardiolipin synthase